MKLMKTKLGLSVLALALVGAGAWSLQSPVTASAEVDMSGFKMENGASVCLSGVDVNENEFNGIRWTTTVEPSFYTSAQATENSEFGVIVAPTSLFDGDLTFDTTLTNGSQVKKLPVKNINASSEAKKYYSVIDYSELGDASEAYKLELTARAYVDVNGDGDYSDCIYADMTGINTSRSARQVAVSAELAGVVEENDMEKAREYYGSMENVTANVDFVKNTGAKGTQYIDMVNDTTVDVAITVDGTIEEVLIGSKSVSHSYADGTLTLTGLDDIVCGEQYVTVFTDNGIVTKPIIGATKVIDRVEDLKIFNAKGGYGEYSVQRGGEALSNVKDYWKAEQEQGGYYVLAHDIEAEGYKHGSVYAEDQTASDLGLTAGDYNTATWNSADKYVGLPIGLTGTFNGMGYAIKDMEIANEREGFFGIVNGGTVKNVAFTDVKSALTSHAYVVANYLLNATLENVYVKTDEYVENESIGFPMKSSAGIAEYYYGRNSMTSCVVELSTQPRVANLTTAGTGILFSMSKDMTGDGAYGADDLITVKDKEGNDVTILNPEAEVALKCEDVYCVSANLLGTSGAGYDMMLIYYNGTNSITMGDEKDGQAWDNNDNSNNIADRGDGVRLKVHGYSRQVMKGAYRYDTLARLASAGYSFASLTASGCWSVVDNLPVWGS